MSFCTKALFVFFKKKILKKYRPACTSSQDISHVRALNGLDILLDCNSQFVMDSVVTAIKGISLFPKSHKQVIVGQYQCR